MKKILFSLCLLLGSYRAHALPVGNPADAALLCDGLFWPAPCDIDCCCLPFAYLDYMNVRFGFYGDYVYNRHMKVHESGDERQIEHTKIFTNAGYAAVNFCERLDIFATVGATNLIIDTNSDSFPQSSIVVPGGRILIETGTDYSWSVGANAILWQCCCTTIGIEGQYFNASPCLKRVTFSDTLSVYPNMDLKYHEWQVGLGISQRICCFEPYVAVKWSRATIDIEHTQPFSPTPLHFVDLKSQKRWGYAVGVSLVDWCIGSLTAEVRLGDEKALYVNGQVRF